MHNIIIMFIIIPNQVCYYRDSCKPQIYYLYIFQETKPRAGVWRPDRFSKAVHINKWVVLNLDQRTNIASIKYNC